MQCQRFNNPIKISEKNRYIVIFIFIAKIYYLYIYLNCNYFYKNKEANKYFIKL